MAKNFMSSVLDELMGRNRDCLPDEEPKKMSWDDPEMCPFYLTCFCPHELFVNTKADLGACPKIHDEQMKKKYQEEAPGYKRSRNESEFIRFAERMIDDIEGKIKRGKMRIALANGPDGGTYAGPGSKNAERISILTERINGILKEAEEAGCEGDVEKAQGLMKLCDQLKEEREQLKANEINHPWNPDKAMQVCEVCGSYLIIGEAQHRLDDHIMGKQHVGFAMLRKNLEEIRKNKDQREREEREGIERERDRRRAEIERDRRTSREMESSRDKSRRDREKHKEREREDRKRKSRSRSKERDRKVRRDSERSKDIERKRASRDHSRERDRNRHKSHPSSDRRHRKRSRSKSKGRVKKSRSRSRDRDRKRSRSKDKSKHDEKPKRKRSRSKEMNKHQEREKREEQREGGQGNIAELEEDSDPATNGVKESNAANELSHMQEAESEEDKDASGVQEDSMEDNSC